MMSINASIDYLRIWIIYNDIDCPFVLRSSSHQIVNLNRICSILLTIIKCGIFWCADMAGWIKVNWNSLCESNQQVVDRKQTWLNINNIVIFDNCCVCFQTAPNSYAAPNLKGNHQTYQNQRKTTIKKTEAYIWIKIPWANITLMLTRTNPMTTIDVLFADKY